MPKLGKYLLSRADSVFLTLVWHITTAYFMSLEECITLTLKSVHRPGKISQRVKVLPTKPEFSSLDPPGRRREAIPELFSDLHWHAMAHVHTHNK